MKRVILLVSALFAALSLSFAQDVSRSEALQYAREFFSDTPSAALTIAWTGSDTDKPAFYVITREGGGFLILSGSRLTSPVVGYSRTGSFKTEGMPEHMRAWFGEFETDLGNVRRMKLQPERNTLARWDNLGVRTKAGEGELIIESALWDQGYPYNNKCIMDNGTKVITGCVATAMAITLRHNKYPPHGYGQLSGYRTSNGLYHVTGFSIEDHYYDWDNMPLKVTRSITQEQIDQIAQLMFDCGVMIQMDYSPSGSGAVSMYMPSVMAEHFHYSAEALLYRKSMYKPREWFNLIKSELDKDRLVFYSAHDANGQGGHAFVIDGYDANGLLHVNWGWSGDGNAFYDLDMNVSTYRFSESHGAVLGLAPDPEQNIPAVTHLAITSAGLSLESGKIEEGSTFAIRFSSVSNYGNAAYAGPLVVVLTDENDNMKAQLSAPQNFSIPALSSLSDIITGCRLESAPFFKDRVALAARNPYTGELEVLRRDVEAESVGSLATIPNFITAKSSYSSGDRFDLTLFKSGEKFNRAKWYYDGIAVSEDEDYIVLTPGEHEIKVVLSKANGSETIIQELIVN